MSIEVTCACAMTYRLPDRYAGKRCRCRECGGPIEVPRDGEARRKAKAKRTTRRLGSQDHEIMSEHRTLRGKTRPVSESMHQLSPLDMSRALEAPEALAPRKPKRARTEEARGRASKAGKTRRARSRSRDERDERELREERARDRRDRDRARRERDDDSRSDERVARRKKDRKKSPAAKPKRARDEDREERKAKKAKGKAKAKLEAKHARGKKAARPEPESAKKRVRPGTRSGARRRDDELEEREGGRRRDPVMAAVIIAAILCLAVGLIIGVALQGNSGAGGEELQQKLAGAEKSVEALKAKREWDAARAALSALLPELDQAEMTAEASKAREELRLLDTLAKLSAIEDEEERLATLLQYAAHKDVAVRLGVTHELRGLSERPEAQDALATLARDQDARVAETARQGLIAAGGPNSLPYLAQAIVDAAATGNKQGDIALQRALEIDDPRVVDVLIKAIEVRASAPKGVLLPVLTKLRDLGEPSAKAAVKTLTSHADPEVKALAEKVLEDLGG